MDSRKISICIPTYNRYEMTIEAFSKVIDRPEISEIVIVDDCSTDDSLQRLIEYAKGFYKVKVYKNPENLDCYRNKARAVQFSSNNWCILLDSDNIIDTNYLDAIYSIPEWHPNVVFCPTLAKPHFDYREFTNILVSKENLHTYIENVTFQTALNTANYFVNKNTYLKAFDDTVNPHTSDSIYMAYRFLEQGNGLIFLEGLEYEHRVHDGSHYKQNNSKTGNFHKEVLDKLRVL